MADLNKKEIEELRRLINLLGKDIKGVDFDTLIKSGNAANTVLNSLRKEAEEFIISQIKEEGNDWEGLDFILFLIEFNNY